MTQKFTKRFTDPKTYRQAVDAAKTLGFEPEEIRLLGTWEAEGEPFFGDSAEEVVKAGDKYFHLRMTVDDYKREVWRCEPMSKRGLDDGSLVVTFREVEA